MTDPTNPPIIDWDGDPTLRAMRADYVASLPEVLDQIRSAERDADWEALKWLAHQLKGAAGTFGFERLSERGGDLRTALVALTFDTDRIRAGVTRIAEEIGKIADS